MQQSVEPEFTTIPRAARALGIGVRPLRRAVRAGLVPVFYPSSPKWPRVRVRDAIHWLESTCVRPTQHAEQVVAALLEREGRTQ